MICYKNVVDVALLNLKNDMFTIFLQQILSGRLLLVVTGCHCWVKKVISVLNLNLNQ